MKIYYHTILAPQPEPSDGNNLPEIPVDTSDEAFSIWIVFAIVIGSIVALIGLYMIITLSKDEMEEMLGQSSANSGVEDFGQIEDEFVDYD